MESHVRSIMKAVSWRLGGTTMTAAIAYIISGDIRIAAAISAFDTVVKIGAFYAHERLWARIKFGRSAEPEYQARKATPAAEYTGACNPAGSATRELSVEAPSDYTSEKGQHG